MSKNKVGKYEAMKNAENLRAIKTLVNQKLPAHVKHVLKFAVKTGNIIKVQELLQKYNFHENLKSEALENAIKFRHFKIMKVLLKAKAKPSSVAIFETIEFGTLEDLQNLIQGGGSIKANDCFFGTTLHAAAYYGKFDIVKYLVDSGMEQIPNSKMKWTPLHAVLNFLNESNVNEDQITQMAKFLIHHGADVNAKDIQGQTPISRASFLEYSFLVQTLIDFGAKFKEPGYYEAIFSSIESKSTKSFEILVKNGLNLNQKYERFSHQFTLLQYAVHFKNMNMIKLLIEKGVNTNDKNEKSQTPLHIILNDTYENLPRKPVPKSKRTEIAKFLITNGADIESQNSKKYTPLHLASQYGFSEVVKLLIEKGANVNAKTNIEATPLHLSVAFNNKEITEMLLDNGAEMEEKDDSSSTPFQIALINERRDMAKLLISKGAKVHFKVKALEGQMSPLNVTLLHGWKDIAELLLLNGVNPNESDYYSNSPLHNAVKIEDMEFIELLVKYGADLSIKNDRNQTVLDLAKEKGSNQIFDFLLKKCIESKEAKNVANPPIAKRFKLEDCVICCTPRDEIFVFNPCGHSKTCESCTMKILHMSDISSNCPVCREKVLSYLKVFV